MRRLSLSRCENVKGDGSSDNFLFQKLSEEPSPSTCFTSSHSQTTPEVVFCYKTTLFCLPRKHLNQIQYVSSQNDEDYHEIHQHFYPWTKASACIKHLECIIG